MQLKRFLAVTLASAALAAAPAHAVLLKWAAQNDILTLDPHSQNHATTISLLQHAYEPLVRYDKNFQVEPCLAASWQQISPTQWRFNLRKNVKFHDGSPVHRGRRGVFLWTHQAAAGHDAAVRHRREGREEDRRLHRRFLPRGPEPGLPAQPASIFHIMSKTWAEKNKAQNVQNYKDKEQTYASNNANGTGAYIIKLWESDKRIVLAANPAWWDKREGNVTEVIYTPIKADATRVAALLAGDVDMVTDLPTQDMARLRQDAKLKVLDGAENRTIFIALDQGSDRIEVRRRQGQEPVQGRARAARAQHGGGSRGDQARDDARPFDSGRRS